MTLALFFASAAESDSLVESDIVAQDRGLANHHAHSVIDEKTPADGCAGMDFDSGQETSNLREPAWEQPEAVHPEPMGEVMYPARVNAGIAQKYCQG
jgi:hypothetical protein